MPSRNPDFFDEQTAPNIPLAVVDWLDLILPRPEIVAYRTESEWNFLAGIEEVKRTLRQTCEEQRVEADLPPELR